MKRTKRNRMEVTYLELGSISCCMHVVFYNSDGSYKIYDNPSRSTQFRIAALRENPAYKTSYNRGKLTIKRKIKRSRWNRFVEVYSRDVGPTVRFVKSRKDGTAFTIHDLERVKADSMIRLAQVSRNREKYHIEFDPDCRITIWPNKF